MVHSSGSGGPGHAVADHFSAVRCTNSTSTKDTIDHEAGNHARSSACSDGLVVANHLCSVAVCASTGARPDLVVVSEVQAVTLPANRRVDLRCRCPWLSAADR
jgi:hypothetical protein